MDRSANKIPPTSIHSLTEDKLLSGIYEQLWFCVTGGVEAIQRKLASSRNEFIFY